MAIELWIGQELSFIYKQGALFDFLQAIQAKCGLNDCLYLVLANYYLDGHQIDLTVLKNDAVIIIEFNHCSVPLKATENGSRFFTPDGEVVGIDSQNLFEQARDCRFRWINLLANHQDEIFSLGKFDSKNFLEASVFVVITPSLNLYPETHLFSEPWFRFLTLDQLVDFVYQQNSPNLNFSNQELRKLVVDVLHLKQSQLTSLAIQDNLYNYFKESLYPQNHYTEEIQAIKQIIENYSSLFIMGISGAGKSNLLRFLVSNPAVQIKNTVFIYVDGNSLDWHQDQATLQEEILTLIKQDLAVQCRLPQNSGPARYILRVWMTELSKNGPTHLVIVFDRSELLQQGLEKTFFDYLRALRDINPRLSYIFGGRNLLPEAFGALTDTLWNEPYWFGPLSIEDARLAIKRHLNRLGIELEEAAIEKLLICVGRHPGLLKYACELVQVGRVNLKIDNSTIIEALLAAPVIERQCRDIWQDFDLATQDLLRHVARDEAPDSPATIEWLTRCGILEPGAKGRARFTSALFKKYVAGLGPPPLRISDGLVFKGSAAINLSREEFRLFATLWDNQPNVVSHDQISQTVWPEVQGEVTPQMITSLVMRLRDKLGDSQYIDSVRGRGYRFNQGTAPLPRSAGAG